MVSVAPVSAATGPDPAGEVRFARVMDTL